MRYLRFFVFLWLAGISTTVWAAEQVREISITAAISPTFKYDPDWQMDVRDRIVFANKIFEPNFGLHFTIRNYIAWDPEDETRETSLLIEELKGIRALKEDEIVIGFHKMSQPFSKDKVIDYHTLGTAQSFRGYVVVRDPFQRLERIQKDIIMVHEMGHLFGAVHVGDENAIMHATVPVMPEMVFDYDNKEIIGMARLVDFRQGEESLPDAVIEGMIRIYEKLIRQNPHSDFYYQLGHFYQLQDQSAKAVSIWEEAVRYHYDNPYIQRELGFYYFQGARYEQAIQALGTAIAHYVLPSQKKQKATALNYLGAAYFEKGNYEQAIFSWLQGLAANPDDLTLQGNLAVAYLQTGNESRGREELEKIVAKDPNDVNALSNLGVTWLRAKEPEKAIQFFNLALDKILDGAEASGKKTDSFAPNLLGSVPRSALYLNLGAAYLDLNVFNEAARFLELSKSLDPENFEIHRNLAQAYLGLQNYEGAVKEIETALRYKKDDPYLYAFLGSAYAAQGKMEDAIRVGREGLRYAEDELAALFHKNIAALYTRDGRYAEAIEELRAALNGNWTDAESHARLGVLQARAGQTDYAKRSLKTALRIDPNYLAAKETLDAIEQGQQIMIQNEKS
ncbi:MAG: tetratricopeptide repeat protein [Candidatus Omnitrophica bacterium]|nr:tetratricopeptide repeat protein [Candidatus Omnitrophota bacterium]